MNLLVSWKYKLKAWLVRYLADPFVRALFASCRWEIEGLEDFLKNCEKEPVLISLWHESLLIMPYFVDQHMQHLSMSALISKSRDGKLMASLSDRFPKVTTIEVAHNSKHVILKQMIHSLEQGRTVFLTPDGPQGPWKKVKPGILQAAYLAKATIWAMEWVKDSNHPRSEVKLPTADAMRLPLPFQKIRMRLSSLGKLEQKEDLPLYQERLERRLGHSFDKT